MSPDRSHLHHRLLEMGFGHRHVVIGMYAITAMAAGLGMFMMLTRGAGAFGIFFCVLLLLVLVFHVAGAVRLQEVLAGFRRKHAVSLHMKHEIERFEEAELHLRQAETFDQWWQAVCTAAEQLDFMSIKLPLKNRDMRHHILVWQRDDNVADPSETVKMKIPIRGIKTGSGLNIEVYVNVNGSLESVGRRAALFGRLLDEHDIVSLPGNEIRSESVARKQTTK